MGVLIPRNRLCPSVLEALLLALGFTVGILIGRWWALIAAIPLGVWSAYENPIENSPGAEWEVGAAVAAIAGAALAAGVWLRRRRPRSG
jgi:hypothetical protein